MVRQYPDILKWVTEGTPSTIDPETGDPIPGTPGEEIDAKCRYEDWTGGVARTWMNKDGESVVPTGKIYIKFREDLPVKFEVIDLERVKAGISLRMEILDVYHGQMNSTITVYDRNRNS